SARRSVLIAANRGTHRAEDTTSGTRSHPVVECTDVKLDARLNLFITLVAVFMVCLVVGDIMGGKLTSFHLFGGEWVYSVVQSAFPVTFILTDILNEFYGRKVVRRITYLAFFMVGLTFCIIYLSS